MVKKLGAAQADENFKNMWRNVLQKIYKGFEF